jgi:hypothetical protein
VNVTVTNSFNPTTVKNITLKLTSWNSQINVTVNMTAVPKDNFLTIENDGPASFEFDPKKWFANSPITTYAINCTDCNKTIHIIGPVDAQRNIINLTGFNDMHSV